MDPFSNDWSTPPRPSEESLQMDLVAELQDGGFEPQIRARSNTWPLPRPENFVETNDDPESTKASNQHLSTDCQSTVTQNSNASKKNSSRRNAWGNLSYADLITHAIGSAPDKRLTLSQIYEWMVQNVPYFKDKGDSNSSAGWKNSIRHNLSLHNRFMRVQNEGTGKSSWWMLNPDAKPGKSVRRRAASMETSKYEKRRGRAKKRVETLKNAGITGINDATPSPSSSVSEGLDHFPESPLHSGGFQLSPDFRQRASSNASSVGRLSPIPAIGVEPDWGFSLPSDYQSSSLSASQANDLDQLAGELADELTLQKEFLQGFSNATGIPNQPPPPYQPPQPYSMHATVAQSYGMQQNQCPLHRSLPCTCMSNCREGLSPSSGTGMSPSYPHSEPSSDSLNNFTTTLDSSSLVQQQKLNSQLEDNTASTLIGQCMEALNNQTQIDDFNIENFHGGLECNLEELIQQELNYDGLLDFNMPLTTTSSSAAAAAAAAAANNQNLINQIATLTTTTTITSTLSQSSLSSIPLINSQLHHNNSTTNSTTTSNLIMTNGGISGGVNNLTIGQIGLQHPNLSSSSSILTTTTNSSLSSSSTTTTTNSHAKVQQYSQTSVTPPSWVH